MQPRLVWRIELSEAELWLALDGEQVVEFLGEQSVVGCADLAEVAVVEVDLEVLELDGLDGEDLAFLGFEEVAG